MQFATSVRSSALSLPIQTARRRVQRSHLAGANDAWMRQTTKREIGNRHIQGPAFPRGAGVMAKRAGYCALQRQP